MKKRLTLGLASVLFATVASAIPALPFWRTVTLADGTKVEAKLVGDEHFHYYVTRDGRSLYAMGGQLREITATALSSLRQKGMELRHSADTVRARRAAQNRIKASTTYTGTKRCLVILAEFPDVSFTVDNPLQYYENICNEVGYQSDYGTTGSVHDYFHSQSYGQFDLQFDVVGPVMLPQNSTWYGEALNYNGHDYNDYRAGRMIVAAVKAAAATNSIDFSQYDWDDDGEVDQIYVVYAGKGAATDDDDNLIWPHESTLNNSMAMDYYMRLDSIRDTGGRVTVIQQNQIYSRVTSEYNLRYNGKKINTYACGNEYTAAYASRGYPRINMGIGLIAHEFSHCLGLPDMYDTSGAIAGGTESYSTGNWDLMSVGSYNGPMSMGWCPAGFNAYERNFCGWLTYTELHDNDSIKNMPPIEEQPVAYIVYNPADRNEYYTLENRGKIGWDQYTANNGLLIHHVDYDAESWRGNTVNANDNKDGHQHLVIVPADNNLSLNTERYDTYPYNRRDSLTDRGAGIRDRLWNENTDGTKYLHARFVNIRKHSDNTVSFNYNPQAAVVDAIDRVAPGDRKITAVYRLDGAKVSASAAEHGVFIIRYNDGSIEKTAR